MATFTSSDGLRLHYEDEGDGLPILCLAGLTRNTRDFDFVAPHLTDVRLIRMDYRGRGQSQWADDPLTYSIPREALDVLELIDHLGLPRAALLGSSRGGLIGMVLAATAKDRLLGLALNDVGPELTQSGLDSILTYLGRPPVAQTLDALASGYHRFYAPAFPDVPLERWRQHAENTFLISETGAELAYDPRLRDAVIAGMQADPPDLWPLFDAVAPLPCALIRGANSDLLSVEAAAKMASRNPAMIVAEVPNRGHIPFLDEPQALAALREWIRTLK